MQCYSMGRIRVFEKNPGDEGPREEEGESPHQRVWALMLKLGTGRECTISSR